MAVLEKRRRRMVMRAIPPLKCSAHAKSTGRLCRRWVNVGTTVCHKHGAAAPQVMAEAEKRITLAEALVTTPRRQPWEVLEHAHHVVDVLLQQVLLDIQAGNTVTPQLYDKLISAVERASRLAKVNLDAGIDQRKLRLAEAQAGQMHQVFTRVLSGLGLTVAQKALVPQLLRREIEGVLMPNRAAIAA